MTLLADHEIKELCLTSEGMIWPFYGRQVKRIRTVVRNLGEGVRGVDVTRVPADEFGDEADDSTIQRVISYGLSSFGYDVRAAPEWRVFTPTDCVVIDPKAFDPKALVDRPGPVCIIPPGGYALTRTMEEIRMPCDVHALCVGKSTYARCGIIVNTTPIEAGWRGHITIEISNSTSLPVKVYAHEGIAQLMFFRGRRPEVSYADRNGKYQGQRGITLPKV